MDLAEIIQNQRTLEAPRRRRRRRPRQRKLRASGTAATDTVRASKQIRALSRDIQKAVRELLFPVLRRLEADFIQDSTRLQDDFADDIQAVLDQIKGNHLELAGRRASLISADMTTKANERNRKKFFGAIEGVIGIDLSAVVDESQLTTVLKMKTAENVGLIKSIPEEYLKKVETLVYENVVQGRTSSKSLLEDLRELGELTDRRARFIARDQTAKLTGAINQARNEALGITEYIWRTSRDERVRKTHRANNGKKFRWDDPPKGTGHPSQDFQCRCTSEPIIVV